ncbi:hypothetical protein [Vitiosangium sp. GDMCC 1.1324]|uniref:hypothetical protein n=1 Tax=Vitiosangium sp. (strain GDMCC 1.1324) TaxID=2138576 RepID=UPI000D34352D|nr:hypothetical protein [Vitiosangium sp. GDMCC 1.1324]PTL77122.1 hypothetical protein DAT35_46655 [Vitiosangium sp. GDMCC 1.1324]
MAEKNWGNCKGCRYFDSHHPNPGDAEVAQCTEPELREFDLKVSGMSGCNEFEARTGVPSSVQQEPAPSLH